MDTKTASKRWARVWPHAWRAKDVEAIAALYADGARYRALAFRSPDGGRAGVRRYLKSAFESEVGVECWFGEPIVDGDRAAVEWWASWIENGDGLTLAGTTILRFDADGLVVDHRDYWNEAADHVRPYEGW